jgi:hypothetical protein
MQDIFRLVVLVAGIIGLALGLYGLFMPGIQRRLAAKRADPEDLPHEEQVERALTRMRRDFAESFEAPAPPQTIGDSVPASFLPPSPPRVEDLTPIPIAPEEPESIEDDYDEPQELPDLEDAVEDGRYVESSVADPEEPEPIETPPSEESPEPAAEASKDDPDDIMSFFGEFTEASKVPTGLKESIEEVTIADLLEEARQVRARLADGGRKTA